MWMNDRCCVFVDGENLRHSIVDLFRREFQSTEYLPKQAQWAGLYDWMVGEAVGRCHRLRTYWYVVEHVDFYPYRFPRPERARDMAQKEHEVNTLRKLLSRHEPYRAELATLAGEDLLRAMKKKVGELTAKKTRMQNRFSGWTTIQNGIVERHESIEFRRAGSIRYNLFDGSLGTEKAVDVKLATDLILLRDIYDVAVIVSGDQDYVPAVQAVKDSGKTVINVSFETSKGRLLPGGAWRLNLLTDKSLRIPHDKLRGYLCLPPASPLSASAPSPMVV